MEITITPEIETLTESMLENIAKVTQDVFNIRKIFSKGFKRPKSVISKVRTITKYCRQVINDISLNVGYIDMEMSRMEKKVRSTDVTVLEKSTKPRKTGLGLTLEQIKENEK